MINKEVIVRNRQAHLLAHYELLNDDEKQQFAAQLETVDFDNLSRLYEQLVDGAGDVATMSQIEPIEPILPSSEMRLRQIALGEAALRDGRVAVLLLAGGQGSRLGHDGPKGTFDIGVAAGRSLFELHANNLNALARRTGVHLPWLIMTSAINHKATVEFFKRHNYFNYPPSSVTFFEQGSIEAVDFDGRVIIEDRARISRSPDGNGGCFKALKNSGLVDELIDGGYQWLFIFNVDNAIVDIADPAFVGFAIESDLPCAIKVVAKTAPEEKVGVPCMVDGKPTIVEYSELSDKMLHEVDAAGKLRYRGGNIGNYCLCLDALKSYLDKPLNYHLATKKIPYLDGAGRQVKPTAPNGYKFELFIFDIFPAFAGMSVLEVAREMAFAPVKNATGEDSPLTAKALFENKYALKKDDDCE